MKSEISSIRQEYLLASLSESDADANPIIQFQKWFQEALNASIDDANAMTLSTVDENHHPKSRIVLLKGIEQQQLLFYTNYNSHKGKQIAAHPDVALNFLWKELQRQVRVEGKVVKVSEEESVAYFNSRPLESQLGAWASSQSEVLVSRAALEERFEQFRQKFNDQEVPKPPHWGGFALDPVYFEFWQGRANRLHDRICYTKTAEGAWEMQRLNP